MKVIGLILSAGESSRMGQPKALLTWAGKTFLAHAVEAAQQAGIESTVVLIGAHAQEILPEANRLHVETFINGNWRSGMGSSIKAGLHWIEEKYPDATAILIQLCDQPKVAAGAISKLLTAHRDHPEQLVCARYNDLPGVPALFPKNFFSALLAIQDQEGAKKLLLQNEVVVVDIPEACQDIDTPEQFADLKKSN